MRSILLTGATGFIGRRLLVRLLEDRGAAGAEVRCFAAVRPGSEGALPAGAELVPWDMSGELPLDRMPAGVDAVVHLAAPRGPVELPELTRVVVDATARLFDWARRAGARHVVHVSTASVLRPRLDVGHPLFDTNPRAVVPALPHTLAKTWAEDLAVLLRAHVEAVTIVRPGTVYGPGQGERGAFAGMVQRILAGEPIALAPPDGHRFTPVFVDDVVEVLLWSLRHPGNETYSVSGPEILSEREVAEDLGAWLGKPPVFEATAAVPMMFAVSPGRIDKLFPERPRTSWQEGLRRTWPREGDGAD